MAFTTFFPEMRDDVPDFSTALTFSGRFCAILIIRSQVFVFLRTFYRNKCLGSTWNSFVQKKMKKNRISSYGSA